MTNSPIINFTPTAASAKQDKIELTIGDWFVHTIDATMSAFITHLGSVDISERAFHSSDNHMVQVHRNASVKILSSQTSRNRFKPLFSGQLKIIKISDNQYRLRLHLSINPTRFCCYQPAPIAIGTRRRLILSPNTVLFTQLKTIVHESERSLDRNDNVALTPQAKQNCHPSLYQHNFRKYIQSINHYMHNLLESFSSYNQGIFTYNVEPYYSLKSLETYWEVEDENSTPTVKFLEDEFRRITSNNSVREYASSETTRDFDAVSLSSNLRAGERIKIYAKTNKRIRIEISHKLKENPSLMNGAYTCENIDRLFEMIDTLAVRALTEANRVLIELNRTIRTPRISHCSAMTFVIMLYKTVGEIDLAEEILQELAFLSGINRKKQDPQKIQALNNLVSAGVLIYHKRPICRYTLSPRFSSAVTQLTPALYQQNRQT